MLGEGGGAFLYFKIQIEVYFQALLVGVRGGWQKSAIESVVKLG